jgi:competence protein ComFC
LEQKINFKLFYLIKYQLCIICDCEINSRGTLCNDCYSNILHQVKFCSVCAGDCKIIFAKYSDICEDCSAISNNNRLFDGKYSLFNYTNVIKKLILKLKNQDDQFIYAKLVELALNNNKKFFENIDFIIPIHLHWTRRLIRGFDQSQIIALQLSKLSKIQVKFKVLFKSKKTKLQHEQSYQNRFLNIKNSFSLKNYDIIIGKNIIIIDDVVTSGATSTECAKLLKQYGAKTVKLFTIAKTVLLRDEHDN